RLDHHRRRRRERVRSRRPERRHARPETPPRRPVDEPGEREAGERRVLPRNHRLRRRHAEHGERDIARRSVDGERDERARARGERFGRGAEQPGAREAELADTFVDELPLRRAGAEEHGARRRACQTAHQLQRIVTLPLAAAGAIGDYDDFRAGGSRDVGRARQVGRERFDRRRLRDVERLAFGNTAFFVDQPDRSHEIAPREQVRERSSQLARADDGHLLHRCDIVMAMQSLRGKVAFVTGGSRGIGLAIARALVSDGVQVAITGQSAAHLSSARPKIEAAGPGSVETFQADVRRHDDVQRAIEATVARFGGLDFVINNAGVGVFTDVASTTPSQWADVIDTNLTGVFNTCHAALPHLRRRGGGFIINISSLAGKNPFAEGAAYCASKSGLNGFSEALMQEVRYDNIRVSYVMPGSVATGFGSGGQGAGAPGLNDASKGADWKISADEVAEVVVNLLRHNPRSL